MKQELIQYTNSGPFVPNGKHGSFKIWFLVAGGGFLSYLKPNHNKLANKMYDNILENMGLCVQRFSAYVILDP